MNGHHTTMLLILLTLFAFVINLPFGWLRSKQKKFSFYWFLYIHLPIPFVIVCRLLLGFSIRIVPLILAASIAGQVIGARLDRFRCRREET